MPSIKIDLENLTSDQIYEHLRQQMGRYSKNPLRTWRWWSGFMWGVMFMAVMNIGDAQLCFGECDGAGIRLIDAAKEGK